MAYLLDSDVFIRAKNDHYHFSFCPGFWEWIIEANKSRRLHSIESVYDELVAGDDDLADWVKTNRQLFLPVLPNDLESLGLVNRWAIESPDYDAVAKNEFASAADSFLIGQALSGGHIVVTHERISDGRRRIKIPNAAAAVGVKYVNPFQMLRTERVRFVLDYPGPRQTSLF